MAKNLQIGSTIYEYPEPGEGAGWSEGATSWAEGVTDALATVQGPNDIILQTATLANGELDPVDVVGLSFDTGQVQHVTIEFLLIRTYTEISGIATETESGTIIGNYNSSDFFISPDSVGDVGVDFSITRAGQVQYVSEDRDNTQNLTIKFKARTIDQ